MDNTRVSSIVQTQLPPLKPTNSVDEAFLTMEKYSISSVVISDEANRPIGIFTEHDSLKIVATQSSKDSKLSNVMTKDIFYITEDTYIHDAYSLMEKKGFRHLVVVDKNNHYKGVVTEGDFLRHMGFEEISKHKSVEDAMSTSILTITKESSIVDTAKLMSDQRCNYAVVLDSKRPVHVVSEREITNYCSNNKDIKNKNISVVIKNSLSLVKRNISLEDASKRMRSHGIHQLIVVDDDERLIGLITRHDILKAVHEAYFNFLMHKIELKNENEKKLQESRDELENKTIFLNSVINTIPDPIWLKDMDGKYLACNRMFERFFGASEDEIIGKTDYDFVSEDLANFFREHDKKAIEAGGSKENEEFLVFADGSHEGLFDTTKTPLKDVNGNLMGVLGIAHDVNERKAKEEQLSKLANYDTLTHLPNRAFFRGYLQKSIQKAISEDKEIAFIIFDLDRFKDINDSYGHTIGDELLKEMSNRLTSMLREGDLIARLGGDEFAMVMDNVKNREEVAGIIKEVISKISSSHQLSNGIDIQIESSAGIVMAPVDGDSVEELLQYADSALYEAKKEGHGMFRFYNNQMTKLAKQKVDYENRLRVAIEKNEFEVYYQPQVHMQTGRIVGAEALVRWNTHDGETVSPVVFIPIAEESGLINQIGEWVINDVCRQGKIWHNKGHRLTLAVNVSANQVKHQNVPEIVTKALKKSGFEADKLELEITESALMNREEEVVAMLHSLRAKGIRLAIDDFGTGYSSLSYLKRFPIDVLKIDKSFIDDIPYEKDDMAIVIAIIEMGKALGYQVLAEGAEHIEQINFLKEKGCTMYQGYYKSKPLKAAEFEKLLKEQES